MNLNVGDIYIHKNEIIKGNTIDLEKVTFIHPWSVAFITLLLIERSSKKDKKLILPINYDVCTYLHRIKFQEMLRELKYNNEADSLESFAVPSHNNLNLQELMHCQYRDEFNARLDKILQMFKNFGLNTEDASRATALVGELGNNVFDHNLGNWPTNVVGSILVAQRYPRLGKIEIAIADPGVGFLGSLKTAIPTLVTDLEAIRAGLSGNSGRVGEIRGNGLKLVQRWTIKNFAGMVMIHSGNGLVLVDKDGTSEYNVPDILGTVAQFVIHYK